MLARPKCSPCGFRPDLRPHTCSKYEPAFSAPFQTGPPAATVLGAITHKSHAPARGSRPTVQRSFPVSPASQERSPARLLVEPALWFQDAMAAGGAAEN